MAESLNPQMEHRIGSRLAMHTGINTGLVVTGEIDLQKGTERVLGDTINLASRLTGLAGPGEIFVGEETYHQAEGYFDFEELPPAEVKGKQEPVRPCKVLAIKHKPVTIHHISRLRADLVGRQVELSQLEEAVARLERGLGTVISVSGEAGNGKSRLVGEFKAALDLERIQWREGYAAENFGMLRHIALNLLKNDKKSKIGNSAKRKKAGWDNEYLLRILSGI